MSTPITLIDSSDQFAFRPTGSTTGALTQLLHTVTHMLQTEPYVHVIALDFSKAFNAVRHHTLLAKFLDLPISDCTYNWLLEHFSKRRHCTKVGHNFGFPCHKCLNCSGFQYWSCLICHHRIRPLHYLSDEQIVLIYE